MTYLFCAIINICVCVNANTYIKKQFTDSLTTEKVNGKLCVIHKVEPNETLYAISRRYRSSVKEIVEFNKIKDNQLSIGQIIRVPLMELVSSTLIVEQKGLQHIVTKGETLYAIAQRYGISVETLKTINSLSDGSLSLGQRLVINTSSPIVKKTKKIVAANTTPFVHLVKPKETLFSISKHYNVSVADIKDWNNLAEDALNVGQQIRIRRNVLQGVVESEYSQNKKVSQANISISERLSSASEIKELGVAKLMEGAMKKRKYLAMHNKAKIGSIIKVRNTVNNQEIFVRVVGPLNNDQHDGAIIRISKSAFDMLGGIKDSMNVSVTYYE